jgi:hypothetical protein
MVKSLVPICIIVLNLIEARLSPFLIDPIASVHQNQAAIKSMALGFNFFFSSSSGQVATCLLAWSAPWKTDESLHLFPPI